MVVLLVLSVDGCCLLGKVGGQCVFNPLPPEARDHSGCFVIGDPRIKMRGHSHL